MLLLGLGLLAPILLNNAISIGFTVLWAMVVTSPVGIPLAIVAFRGLGSPDRSKRDSAAFAVAAWIWIVWWAGEFFAGFWVLYGASDSGRPIPEYTPLLFLASLIFGSAGAIQLGRAVRERRPPPEASETTLGDR